MTPREILDACAHSVRSVAGPIYPCRACADRAVQAAVREVEAQRDALLLTVVRYARHPSSCKDGGVFVAADGRCSCGLNEAVAPFENMVTPALGRGGA